MKHELNANIAPDKMKVPRWLAILTAAYATVVILILAVQLLTDTTFLVAQYSVYDIIVDGGVMLVAMYIFFVMKRYKLYAGLAALALITAGVFALAEIPNNHTAWHSTPYGFSNGDIAIVAVVQQEKNVVTVYPRANTLFIENEPLCTVPLPEDFAYLDVTFDGGATLSLYDEAEDVLGTTSIPLD